MRDLGKATRPITSPSAMSIPNLNVVELSGYIASLLVFSTFYMKTMVPLRFVAITSNVAFMTYGYLAGLTPVFLLHLVLFPLNIWRLYQIRKLLDRVRQTSRGDFSIEPILHFMTKAEFKEGDALFRQGDRADKIYYLVHGSIHFPEIQTTAAPGELIGEVGVFSPQKTRTASAIVERDSTVLILGEQKVLELYYQNPEFGLYLVRLIIQHLMHQTRVGRDNAPVRETMTD